MSGGFLQHKKTELLGDAGAKQNLTFEGKGCAGVGIMMENGDEAMSGLLGDRTSR